MSAPSRPAGVHAYPSPQYLAIEPGEALGWGASDPFYARFHGIAKPVYRTEAASEWLAAHLATILGLPVPVGFMGHNPFMDESDRPYLYASLRFGSGQEPQTPPPVNVPAFVDAWAELAASITVFDTWIANEDRNKRNLAWVDGRVQPVIFDHAAALLGRDGVRRLDRERDRNGLGGGHCLASFLRNSIHVNEAIRVVQALPIDRVLPPVLATACASGHLVAGEPEALLDFLQHRRGLLQKLLIEDNLLEGLTNEALPLP